jgi:hypothetical protein
MYEHTSAKRSDGPPRPLGSKPYAIVTLAALVVTAPHWLPDRIVLSFDAAVYAGPHGRVTRDALLRGDLPLVDPGIFAGAPHMANLQTGVLSPIRWLTLPFETWTANGLIAALSTIVLATGVLRFIRSTSGASNCACITAAVVVIACGATLTKTVQLEQISVVCWTPWLLDALTRSVRFDRQSVAALTVPTALILVSGHPQYAYASALVAVTWASFLLADRRSLKPLARLLPCVILGSLVAGLQLLAGVAAIRDAATDAGRDLNSLAAPQLVLRGRSLLRAGFGTVLDRDPAAFAGSFESIIGVGVVASAFIVIGVIATAARSDLRRSIGGLALISALALVWSLGPRTPMFTVAYSFLPGFDLGRASARWLIVGVITVAPFIAIGVDEVGQRTAQALVALTGTSVVVGLAVLGPLEAGPEGLIWLCTLLLVLALMLIRARRPRFPLAPALLTLLTLELALSVPTSIPFRLSTDVSIPSGTTSALDAITSEAANDSDVGMVLALTDDDLDYASLVNSLRPNASNWFGIRSIDGYDGGLQVTNRWARALASFSQQPDTSLTLRSQLTPPLAAETAAKFGVSHVLLAGDRDPAEWLSGFVGPLSAGQEGTLWRNPQWLGRVTAFANEDDGPSALAHARSFSTGASCTACPTPSGFDVVESRPERLTTFLDLKAPSIVRFDRQALPGWRATIDGVSTEVVIVDDFFLGVQVPAGAHVVELRYQPWWLTPGMIISFAGLTAFAVATVFEMRRHNEKQSLVEGDQHRIRAR